MIAKLTDLFHKKKKKVNRNHYYVGFLVSVVAFALFSTLFMEPKEEMQDLNAAPEQEMQKINSQQQAEITADEKMIVKTQKQKINSQQQAEITADEKMIVKTQKQKIEKRREVIPVKPLSYLNPRPVNYQSYRGQSLVSEYFNRINAQDYRTACSMLSKNKCSSHEGSDISPYSSYFNGIDGGYDVKDIYISEEQPSSREKVICVIYEYKLKNDFSQDSIRETMQYWIRERDDGLHEISARVCETKTKGERKQRCPIKAGRKYCQK